MQDFLHFEEDEEEDDDEQDGLHEDDDEDDGEHLGLQDDEDDEEHEEGLQQSLLPATMTMAAMTKPKITINRTTAVAVVHSICLILVFFSFLVILLIL